MRTRSTWALSLVAAGLLVTAAFDQAPNTVAPQSPAAYDLQREGSVLGTVVRFNSDVDTPPHGAHVVLQTSSGTLDVHLGNARFLEANHFTIQSGDTLRIIGENVTFGKSTQFVARVVQNGTQALLVRSVQGMPLSHTVPKGSNNKQGGAL